MKLPSKNYIAVDLVLTETFGLTTAAVCGYLFFRFNERLKANALTLREISRKLNVDSRTIKKALATLADAAIVDFQFTKPGEFFYSVNPAGLIRLVKPKAKNAKLQATLQKC